MTKNEKATNAIVGKLQKFLMLNEKTLDLITESNMSFKSSKYEIVVLRQDQQQELLEKNIQLALDELTAHLKTLTSELDK